ncbi:hypothetical protein TNCT_677381 [Trichonephila clavata]|uniref:Uncharacterized protein n=1 Tax=Trichonephila clavata TaxID=2740835 RepID=A0A8X6KX57_TRICU|nr:hypothetical protein TNCT_677381 [Trichonephila clavata]
MTNHNANDIQIIAASEEFSDESATFRRLGSSFGQSGTVALGGMLSEGRSFSDCFVPDGAVSNQNCLSHVLIFCMNSADYIPVRCSCTRDFALGPVFFEENPPKMILN